MLQSDSIEAVLKKVIVEKEHHDDSLNIERAVEKYTTQKTLNYLKENTCLFASDTKVLKTTNLFNIEELGKSFSSLINLHRINDIRYINKFFEAVNHALPIGGTFICCVETLQQRMIRKSIRKIPFLNSIYFFFDFVFMRVFPKVRFLKYFYFKITHGKNRLLSKPEILGRLVCCGFEINNYKKINGLLFISSTKRQNPKYDMNPSYGAIYKMQRVGLHGKLINVYKLRTMHPYSEYLQNYMLENYGSKNGDKINYDFRVSKTGSVFRKFWLDELPMLINLFKGDLKLVGVRPLSINKFKTYPVSAQKIRTEVKPGLIPPFYADLPESFEELVESELNYTKNYLKHPVLTDLKYFFKAMYNIFILGVRSR